MAIIETRGLTKDFGQNRGIFDLDLKVAEQGVHGFLGPNGAGKSTTIRLLLDFLRPTRGDARILGRDARADSVAIRKRVGYVPGELALPETLTGQQFLEDSATMRGIDINPDRRAMLIDTLGADPHVKIRKLSKGNKQKLALVDAFQHEPQLLILDEPTDGLDPLLRHHVHNLLRQHVKDGGTVFLSSHVVHEIQTTCDTVSIVLDGRLRHSERIPDLLAREPTRIEALLGRTDGLAELAMTPEIYNLERRGTSVRFLVEGEILPAMQALLRAEAYDVKVRQHDLEETFLRLYQEDQAPQRRVLS